MATYTFTPVGTMPSGFSVRNSYTGETTSVAGRRYDDESYYGTPGIDTLNGTSAASGDLIVYNSDFGGYYYEGPYPPCVGEVFNIEIFNLLGGNDILDLSGSNDGALYTTSVTVDAGTGNDVVFSGSGDDILGGGDGADYINGDPGNDTVNGGAGADRLRGWTGDDTIFGDSSGTLAVLGGNDTIYGDAGADTLFGDASSLSATGRGGNDTIFGGSGDDILYGDSEFAANGSVSGNDVLNGGAGNDILFGDAGSSVGADRFVFAPGSGEDVIANFDVAVDRIDLKAYALASTAGLFTADGGVTTVTLPGLGNSITIIADGLTATNFILV